MLRNPWKMMKTILLIGTSLMLSVILTAGAHTPQIAADPDRPAWAEQHRAVFTLHEPRLLFRLPLLFQDPALHPHASFNIRNFELSPPPSFTHPNGYADISATFPPFIHKSGALLTVMTAAAEAARPAPSVLTLPVASQSTEMLPAHPPEQPEQPPATPKTDKPAPYKPFITTAYYLNVREEANNKSKIIDVVEKGDILRVVHELDNGWLKLYDEGFVHGAYAEPIAAPSGAVSSTQIDAMRQIDEPVQTTSIQQIKPPAAELSKPVKPSSKVQSKSGLNEQHIAQILKGTDLTDHDLEEVILEIEDEYGINAYFTIAVMKLESGNGKSRLAKHKNNLFGLNATGGNNAQAFAFDTKADSVRKFGELIAKSYVGKGYTTIEKVARKYCPANDDWSKLVHRIMKSDHNKLKKLNLV